MIRKILRRVLGRVLFGNLLRVINYITLPKPIKRKASVQATIDKVTKDLSLYQFVTCPFCIKVTRFMHSNAINIELKDTQKDDHHKSDLITFGGKQQVPCLRVPQKEQQDIWLYESDEIIKYLKKNVLNH
ncbi:MAG: NrdH-redoxin [Woeseiaceae bacterium]|nr:NrdH-redoxin [Woeseiaceae bacterium]